MASKTEMTPIALARKVAADIGAEWAITPAPEGKPNHVGIIWMKRIDEESGREISVLVPDSEVPQDLCDFAINYARQQA